MPAIAIVDSGVETASEGLRQPCCRERQVLDAAERLAGRRPRPRHLRGRASLQAGPTTTPERRRRRRSSRSTSWTTTASRDERRHRGGPVDPGEQGQVQHPRRQLLAPLVEHGEQLLPGPARSRRWRSSGSTAWSWSRRPATTATRTSPAACSYAPGNDPFVITVGAVDIGGTIERRTTTSTLRGRPTGARSDGFMKPELAAPGRYMVGPVPDGSTLAVERADKVVAHRLHPAVGHVLRGTGGLRRSGADPRPSTPSSRPTRSKGALMASTKDVDGAAQRLGRSR